MRHPSNKMFTQAKEAILYQAWQNPETNSFHIDLVNDIKNGIYTMCYSRKMKGEKIDEFWSTNEQSICEFLKENFTYKKHVTDIVWYIYDYEAEQIARELYWKFLK